MFAGIGAIHSIVANEKNHLHATWMNFRKENKDWIFGMWLMI